MKIYPKKFEDVYAKKIAKNPRKFYRRRNAKGQMSPLRYPVAPPTPRVVSFDGMLTVVGMERCNAMMQSWDREIFAHIVRMAWLNTRIRWNGRPVSERCLIRGAPGEFLEQQEDGLRATIRFLTEKVEQEIGRSFNLLKGNSRTDLAICSYIFDFFDRKKFIAHDPFEDPAWYAFPYEHIGMDFLTFVYQMEERFELLELAEKEKWPIHYFRNWVINYAYSYNLDYGNDVFVLHVSTAREPVHFIEDKRIVKRDHLTKEEIRKRLAAFKKLKAFEKEHLPKEMTAFKSFKECAAERKK